MLRRRLPRRAIRDLVRRIDASQKQLAVPLDHLRDAQRLDDVGPDPDDVHLCGHPCAALDLPALDCEALDCEALEAATDAAAPDGKRNPLAS